MNKHTFLPGEKVRHKGKDAEVLDVYPKSVTIRIGRSTYKTVPTGELELCGPDGEAPRGEEVRFG
jgi:hypothetical protein